MPDPDQDGKPHPVEPGAGGQVDQQPRLARADQVGGHIAQRPAATERQRSGHRDQPMTAGAGHGPFDNTQFTGTAVRPVLAHQLSLPQVGAVAAGRGRFIRLGPPAFGVSAAMTRSDYRSPGFRNGEALRR